jgi:acetylglutamate kinase
MQAKLQAALAALRAGVERVTVAPGAAANVLERALADHAAIGTRVVLEKEAA